MWYWQAFWTLSGSRPIAVGMGGSVQLPIPLTEIESYCRLADIRGASRLDFVEIMRAVDAEYLRSVNAESA